MKRGLILMFLIAIGSVVIGCGAKTEDAASVQKKQTGMTVDGKPSGVGTQVPAN